MGKAGLFFLDVPKLLVIRLHEILHYHAAIKPTIKLF